LCSRVRIVARLPAVLWDLVAVTSFARRMTDDTFKYVAIHSESYHLTGITTFPCVSKFHRPTLHKKSAAIPAAYMRFAIRLSATLHFSLFISYILHSSFLLFFVLSVQYSLRLLLYSKNLRDTP